MVLRTNTMYSIPIMNETRICIMRDSRVYNRTLKDYLSLHGRPLYDTMLKDLAPSKELLKGYKEGDISWEQYSLIFDKEVLLPQSELIQDLAQRALSEDITLLCSEKTPDNCHRRLIAEECKRYQPNLEIVIK